MRGITHPRGLRVTGLRGGHLDRLKVNQLLPDAHFPPVPEHFPSLSRESDVPQVLRGSNFGRMTEAVDDVQWPQRVQGSEGRAVPLREISPAPPIGNTSCGNARPMGASLLARSAHQPSTSQRTRSFHTSSRVPYDSTSYNVTDVPDFFIKYKQHRASLSKDSGAYMSERDEGGLMQSLTGSILSGDVVASTRRLKAKIPVEHHVAEGSIVHPSGFVVPGPGHTSTSDVARAKERERNERKDRLVQTAAVAHRVLESDLEQVNATTLPSSHKVPFEVRELDGTVKHPSGFVPPTPAHKFRYTVKPGMFWDRKVPAMRQLAGQPPPRAVLRAVHTGPVPNASGDV